MELHQLRYLVALAEEGSFSRAAARAHVSQPSLSQQIRKLEEEVGQPLFDRLARGVVPTESGKRFLVYARRALADVADARRCVDECRGKHAGRLVVGAVPTIAPYLLPRLVKEFRRRHPEVSVEVVEDLTPEIARGVEDGAIDLGLMSTCRATPSVRVETLGREPFMLAVPSGHRLAGRRRAGWRDLGGERFLVLHEAHCMSSQVRRVCAKNAVCPDVVLRGVQLRTLVEMVAAGMGVSLVPRMVADRDGSDGCVFLPFAPPVPVREITLIRNPMRYQSGAAAAFAALAAGSLT